MTAALLHGEANELGVLSKSVGMLISTADVHAEASEVLQHAAGRPLRQRPHDGSTEA